MKKLIIQNESDLTMVDAVQLELNVVRIGRISKYDKQYCYCTTFVVDGNGYAVCSDLNTASDRLIVINDYLVSDKP